MSTPIVLVTGVDPTTMEAATSALQFDLPAAVVLAHRIDPSSNELVRTVSDMTGVLETCRVHLDHACASCAVREDMLPTLERLSELDRWGAIVAQLPVGAGALQICRVCAIGPDHGGAPLRIAGVLAAVDGATVLEDLRTEDSLTERGAPTFAGDGRGVAESLVSIVEYADAITISGAVEPAGVDLLRALRRPTARMVRDWAGLDSTVLMGGIHSHLLAEEWVAEVRRGSLPLTQTEHVWSIDLRSTTPLHPDRFSAAMEQLCTGTHRIRGCFWLPTRPSTACVLDGAAGQTSIGAHGPWRGTPMTRLVATGVHRDGDERDRLRTAFQACLLTDRELRERGTRWQIHQDGFEPWMGDIHDLI